MSSSDCLSTLFLLPRKATNTGETSYMGEPFFHHMRVWKFFSGGWAGVPARITSNFSARIFIPTTFIDPASTPVRIMIVLRSYYWLLTHNSCKKQAGYFVRCGLQRSGTLVPPGSRFSTPAGELSKRRFPDLIANISPSLRHIGKMPIFFYPMRRWIGLSALFSSRAMRISSPAGDDIIRSMAYASQRPWTPVNKAGRWLDAEVGRVIFPCQVGTDWGGLVGRNIRKRYDWISE